jgi:AbrB family looped-hinge helix DNA binding protein
MKTTIDGAGRIMVPKALRDALGLVAGTRIRIEERDGRLVLSPADSGSWWEERDGRPVLTAPEGTPPLTGEMVREFLERGRR